MKCTIEITGQISGNIHLLNVIQGGRNERQGMFYSYKIDFNSKAAAKRSLFAAWKRLKEIEPEFVRRSDWHPKVLVLKYDASKAALI